ncbi:hypothetical protein R3I93_013320 [Phoxinus phoxinus]|uniref:Uncharacterized protein n=1 Tax=Phoxinus phoxinus TaxID=58324 RepID=A0AAN9H207_9TELE
MIVSKQISHLLFHQPITPLDEPEVDVSGHRIKQVSLQKCVLGSASHSHTGSADGESEHIHDLLYCSTTKEETAFTSALVYKITNMAFCQWLPHMSRTPST